jgi:hypothetical protein
VVDEEIDVAVQALPEECNVDNKVEILNKVAEVVSAKRMALVEAVVLPAYDALADEIHLINETRTDRIGTDTT